MPRLPWPALAVLLCAACFKDLGSDDSAGDTSSTTDKSSSPATTTGTTDIATTDATTGIVLTTGESTGTTGTTSTDPSDPTFATDKTGTADTGGPACGDGIVEGSETCDDANQNADDGCASCVRAYLHVFVTDTMVDGALMGTLAADQQCANEVAKAGRTGDYLAWLSTPAESPKTRFSAGAYPFRLMDETTLVAADFAAVINGLLMHPIDRRADGQPLAPDNGSCSNLVWTGTIKSGDVAMLHCDGFSTNSNNNTGLVGNYNTVDYLWTDACQAGCNQFARLYCFEQTPSTD